MKRKGKSSLSQDNLGYLFILPFILMFGIFKLYPMVYGFVVSFLDRNSLKKLLEINFVGLSNYQKVLKSKTFWEAMEHSLQFSVVYVVLIMTLGFLVAVLLNKKFKGRTIIRTMFYMPYVTNVIAVGIVFKYLLNPTKGPINGLFRIFGQAGPKWLQSPSLALPTTAIISVWIALAFNVITLLAALQEIPEDLFEVADIEGANFWQRMRYVIFPILIPTLFMLLTIVIINSFKNYSTIVGLTEGGPGTSSRVVSLQIYEDAFTYNKFSIASAEGVIFTAFIICINKIFDGVRSLWERKN